MVASTTNAADCHDAGATRPAGVQVIGRAVTTNSGAGTYLVFAGLEPPSSGNASSAPWFTQPSAAGSVSFLTTANVAKLYGVVYSNATPLVTTQVTYNVQTADNTANSYDIGLYSSAGAPVGSHRKHGGHHLRADDRLENLELDFSEHDQAGKILSGDHYELHKFLRGVDWQFHRRRIHFCGRGTGERHGGGHATQFDHNPGRCLHGHHDSDLVAAVKSRVDNFRSITMTRLLPAIFLLLVASRACGSTVNLSWSYDYTGLPVCSATVTKNCMDHFEMQDATGGNAGAHCGGAEPFERERKSDGHQRNVSDVDPGTKDVCGDRGGQGWCRQPGFQRLDKVPGDISGTTFTALQSLWFGAIEILEEASGMKAGRHFSQAVSFGAQAGAGRFFLIGPRTVPESQNFSSWFLVVGSQFMIKRFAISMIVLMAQAWAATYYVDPQGSNANNGLSPDTAWRSLLKVGISTFQPGDVILFKRDGVWNEWLTPPSSGTAGSPIKFDAYGSGRPPRFTGYFPTTASQWTNASGNVWQTTLSATQAISQLKFVQFGTIWGSSAAGCKHCWRTTATGFTTQARRASRCTRRAETRSSRSPP